MISSRIGAFGGIVSLVAAGFVALSPTVSAHAASSGPGAEVCQLHDPRLDGASGLVVTGSGYATIVDRGAKENVVRVYLLDRKCRVSQVLASPGNVPVDIEDLARTADGTFWAGDIGDNEANRENIAIWQLNPTTGAATGYRLSYPHGAHNAEAMIMTADRRPVIVTKSGSGQAQVYVASRPLTGDATRTIPLTKVGDISIQSTTTRGGEAWGDQQKASLPITGGALSSDGRQAVLRTYTDAYEWKVTAGATAVQIAEAIVRTPAHRMPLPDEKQGEAISYTADGSAFLTLSEGAGQRIRRWPKVTHASSQSDDDGFWSAKVAFLLVVVVVIPLVAWFTVRQLRRRR